MANVRFYKLEVLPNFDVSKQGIFVHVTKPMKKEIWDLSNGNKVDPATLWMTLGKDGGSVGRINLVEWLTERNIEEIASGLWFGGENGWELLSNETNAIDATINAKIAALDVNGYAQATITGSTLTISGIKEDNGIIAKDDGQKLEVAIDGGYNKDTNKIATQLTVTTAINNLDASAFQTVTKSTSGVNTVLTFNGIKEVDGIISQGVTENPETFTVGDAKLKIQIGSSTATNVFSANAIEDSTIKLDGYVFRKGDNDVISVITPTAVSERNRLVTEQDIASLGGAMHYKGSIASDTQWPANENVKAGYVWIASGNFEHGAETIELGDLIVFNTDNVNTDYTVVQSNITLGVGDGQVAANVGALADGKLVVGVNPATGSKGIKTVDFDVTNLTGTTGKNERTLSIANGTADTLVASLYHDVTITDALTVIGKPFTKSIKISSPNRSIEIAKNDDTGVMVDLVWNTIME